MPAPVLEELEAKIEALHVDDIASCMQLYDTLSGYAEGMYEYVIDKKIKDVVRRIMASKQQQLSKLTVDLNALKYQSYEEKRVFFNPLTLNHDGGAESDKLWQFLKSTDVDSTAKMTSLGIDHNSYKIWQQRNRMHPNVDDVDNIFAKCICRLDFFIKEFVFMRPTGDGSKAREHTFDGKHHHADMQAMLRMLLETAV